MTPTTPESIHSASNRTPREINRNLIFHLIRKRQPISRADLARVSGLQRSTISLIIEELLKSGWVVEGSTGRLPRGRRPTFLHLNQHKAVVAIDVHPTESTIATVDISGAIRSTERFTLPAEPDKAIRQIINSVRHTIESKSELTFCGIGITLPGRADLKSHKLIFAPNLHWPVLSLKPKIERALKLPVFLENVANACALSEVWFGNGAAMHDLVVLNVAEGIGTGIYANGNLIAGENNLAGEFGHIQIDPNGPACACGNHGCWEVMASNSAALRYYAALSGGKQRLRFEDLLELADSNDSAAVKSLEKMMHELGRGMRMIAAALAPREIIVVGDIATAWPHFGSIATAVLHAHPLPYMPLVRPAESGPAARLRTAVALVLSHEPIQV